MRVTSNCSSNYRKSGSSRGIWCAICARVGFLTANALLEEDSLLVRISSSKTFSFILEQAFSDADANGASGQVDNAPPRQTSSGAKAFTVDKPQEITSIKCYTPPFRTGTSAIFIGNHVPQPFPRLVELLLCVLYKDASFLSLARIFSRWHQSFVIACPALLLDVLQPCFPSFPVSTSSSPRSSP